MSRSNFKSAANSMGLPWLLRWRLSRFELLIFIPTLLMALAYQAWSDAFGKFGVPLHLPQSFGGISNFQPKVFPMEIFLAWVGIVTLSKFRKWPLTRLSSPLILFTLFLITWGLARAIPDLPENPLLVIRNSAFVWYLTLPIMIAMLPISSAKWELFVRVLYFFSFSFFILKLSDPILTANPNSIYWCIDMGLLFGYAYGLCSLHKNSARIALLGIGLALGFSYLGSVQRTTLLGLIVTNALLVISPLFFSGSLPRPRWRRIAWVAIGVMVSIFVVAAARTHEKQSNSIVSEGVSAISNANPARQAETNSKGIEKFRYYLWLDAWNEFKSAPILGIGFLKPVVHRVYGLSGNFFENTGSYEEIIQAKAGKTSPPLSGPHNSYLNALARMGVLGIGLLLLHILCAWLFLTRSYFSCFFVLLWQVLYAMLNVSLEGPIRSFPILILVGIALKLAIEKSQSNVGTPEQEALGPHKRLKLAKRDRALPRRMGLVHVPYRFLGGEDLHVEVLRGAYRSIGLDPISIPNTNISKDLLISATRSLTIGSPSKWDALISRNSIEFLHLNNIHTELGAAFLRWIISRGIPTVMTVHNHRFYCTNGLALYGSEVCKACRTKASFLRPILRNCNASISKTIYHSAAIMEIRSDDLLRRAVTQFLAPSPYIARELQIAGIPAKKIKIFPHAVDVENIAPTHSPVDVAFVGRLSPEKGVAHLLAAAAKLPQYIFAIVGEGPLETEVREAAKSYRNVRFLGKIERKDSLAVMRSARVVCVPSVCHESFSLVAAEALSLGAQLVVPDTLSFQHYIEAPFSAVSAVVANPESLAYSIVTALERPARSPAETALIRERFSPAGFQERLRQVAAEILPAR